MKKHELLEKAMRDYPAGTKFNWFKGANSFTSTGLFSMDGNKVVCDGLSWEDMPVYVYNETWAKVVNPNKIEAIYVKLFNRRDRAVVVKTGVTISVGGVLVTLAHSDIEEIAHAISQLNCDKTTGN